MSPLPRHPLWVHLCCVFPVAFHRLSVSNSRLSHGKHALSYRQGCLQGWHTSPALQKMRIEKFAFAFYQCQAALFPFGLVHFALVAVERLMYVVRGKSHKRCAAIGGCIGCGMWWRIRVRGCGLGARTLPTADIGAIAKRISPAVWADPDVVPFAAGVSQSMRGVRGHGHAPGHRMCPGGAAGARPGFDSRKRSIRSARRR